MPPRKGTPWSAARRAADTPEYRQRLSEAALGHLGWNKGKVGGLSKKQAVAKKLRDSKAREKAAQAALLRDLFTVRPDGTTLHDAGVAAVRKQAQKRLK